MTKGIKSNRFSKLKVTLKNINPGQPGSVKWVCECDCGSTVIVEAGSLRVSQLRTCDCLHKETLKFSKHGRHSTAEYRIWSAIKTRCYNKNERHYDRYGGRGITMCDEWRNSFAAFYQDMGPRPSPKHSIDRRENDKGYYKDNCRWATKREQANNRSSCRFYEIDGERKSLSEWCREFELEYDLVKIRIRRGWSFIDAVKRKPRPRQS